MAKSTFLYVALCPELDVASQGATIEEATANLREAVTLFLETAESQEISRRLRSGVFVTTFDVADGHFSICSRPARKARRGRRREQGAP